MKNLIQGAVKRFMFEYRMPKSTSIYQVSTVLLV